MCIIIVRPSQIVCKVMTMYKTCLQMMLGIHEYLCTVLIPLCKNNLNLQMYFFSMYLIGSFSCSLCCHAWSLASMQYFFIVYFDESQFGSPAINQTSLSQSTGWFLFILLCSKVSLNRSIRFTYKLYQYELRTIYVFVEI